MNWKKKQLSLTDRASAAYKNSNSKFSGGEFFTEDEINGTPRWWKSLHAASINFTGDSF